MSEQSAKPYLVRAICEWCADNGLTPYLAVKVNADTRVPQSFVKNGEIVLNISHSATRKLTVDNDWIRFTTSCKAMLGTESGASVCDFTGRIQRNVEAHVARDPNVDFETLRRLYFEKEDGRIMMNVISPRCFEAAALRTLMILYEGHYSGVLQPWRHYVPLQRDHGNMAEVARVLRDPARAQEIVDRAFREVAQNPAYTFKAMVGLVDRVMSEGFDPGMRARAPGYSQAGFVWRERVPRMRRRAGEAVLRRMGGAWMALPPALRGRLKRVARGTFRLLFGAR